MIDLVLVGLKETNQVAAHCVILLRSELRQIRCNNRVFNDNIKTGIISK